MGIERILGNFGTIRVGATAGIEFYWNRQWTVSYKAATATLTKTVKFKDEDLSALYVRGKCGKGKINLRISQGNVKKDINISSGFNERVDLSGFNAGLIKMELTIEFAKNIKLVIGWRNGKERAAQ